MRSVWVALIHARGVEVPDRRPAHDVDAQRPGDAEVDGGVELLHESALFPTPADAAFDRDGPDHALHEEFASEGEDDGVEGDEGEVFGPFAILGHVADVGGEGGSFVEGWVGVGEEDGGVEGVVLAGGDEVGSKEDGGEDERGEPGVLECDSFPAA